MSAKDCNEKDIIEKIISKSNLTEKEIEKKIKEKISEFSGLVSRTGAIYIVGKEFGLNLIKTNNTELKIKSIVPDMTNVNFKAKLLSKSDIRTFRRNNKEGKVQNIILSDETGTIRMSLWNDEIEKIKDLDIGEHYELRNCYTRKNTYNGPEIRLGRKGLIKRLDSVDFEAIEQATPIKQQNGKTKQNFKDLKEGDYIETKATLTRMLSKDIIFYFCPECKKRLDDNNRCSTHGKIKKDILLVLNGVLEDNYEEIHTVFFRENVERLTGMDCKTIEKTVSDNNVTTITENTDILGNEYIIKGIIKPNNFTKKLELHTTEVNKLNTIDEIKTTLERIEA